MHYACVIVPERKFGASELFESDGYNSAGNRSQREVAHQDVTDQID